MIINPSDIWLQNCRSAVLAEFFVDFTAAATLLWLFHKVWWAQNRSKSEEEKLEINQKYMS